MAGYFFHCRDGIQVDDPMGIEPPTIQSAFQYAKKVAEDITAGSVNGGAPGSIVITDSKRRTRRNYSNSNLKIPWIAKPLRQVAHGSS